jgi:hypothetical protein
MKTVESSEAELQQVLDRLTSGKPVDADLRRRVRARAEEIRKEILAMHGVQDIGVDLIRELRGELPDT